MKSFITIWDWNRWNSFTFYMQCHWMDNKQTLVNDNRAQFWKTFKSCIKLSTRITTAKLSILCKKRQRMVDPRANHVRKCKKVTTTSSSRLEFIINHRYQTITEWLITICSDCDCSWFFSLLFFFIARIVCARRFRVIINREVSHIESNLHLLSVKQAAVAIKIWLCAIVTAAAPWLQRHKSSM